MATINSNFLKLKAGYLFPEIGRRVKAFTDANPDKAANIIRCGIGDVTEPLPAAVLAKARDAGTVVLGSGAYTPTIGCNMAQARQLQGAGVPHILVLGMKNFGFNNNAVMLLPEDERRRYRARPYPELVEGNRDARAAIPVGMFVDLFALLDDGSGTVPVFTPDGLFISQDRRHLTQAGAEYLGRRVFALPQFAHLPPRADRLPAATGER